ISPIQAVADVAGPLLDDALGESASRFHICGVIEKHKGLQRRAGARPFRRALFAGWRVEGQQTRMQERALPVRVKTTAVLIFALVLEPVAGGEVQEAPVAGRLVRLDARPTDLADQ